MFGPASLKKSSMWPLGRNTWEPLVKANVVPCWFAGDDRSHSAHIWCDAKIMIVSLVFNDPLAIEIFFPLFYVSYFSLLHDLKKCNVELFRCPGLHL